MNGYCVEKNHLCDALFEKSHIFKVFRLSGSYVQRHNLIVVARSVGLYVSIIGTRVPWKVLIFALLAPKKNTFLQEKRGLTKKMYFTTAKTKSLNNQPKLVSTLN